jgi:hypothetical protein
VQAVTILRRPTVLFLAVLPLFTRGSVIAWAGDADDLANRLNQVAKGLQENLEF